LARPDKIEKRKAAEAGGVSSADSSSGSEDVSAAECNLNEGE
jgi:hypothetical protein